MPSRKTECDRCGTCCLKGGPALHIEDRELIHSGRLKPEHLITIRKGEPVFSPAAYRPEPAQSEIIKIKGRGADWTCLFFSAPYSSCSIYEHRPLECSLLKCWDTTALEKVAAKGLLSRFDILAPQEPLLPLIKKHEHECSLERLEQLLADLQGKDFPEKVIAELTDLVNRDLKIRTRACDTFHVSLTLELFFFGRPLFKILEQFGVESHGTMDSLRLAVPASFAATVPGQHG